MAQRLQGKVALIVGEGDGDDKILAIALAKKQMDVAFVYFNYSHEAAQEIKEKVLEEGRACHIINAHNLSSENIVQEVIDNLGQLDFYFDFMHESENLDSDSLYPIPRFNLMKAALARNLV